MKKNLKHRLLGYISLALVAAMFMSTAVIPASALSYSGSSSYKSGKYYTALTKVTLTGNQRTDIVNVAKSQIGYQEGSSSSKLSGEIKGNANYTEYGRWYGVQDMWCAMFVSWCANVAGISTSIVPKHSYTPTGLSWFKNKGQAYSRATVASGGYTPQAGDIIYFKSSRNSNPTNHIGIVTSYSGGKIYTIEGNTSSATISTNGGAVAAKSYAITNKYIVYVCKPSYKNTSSTVETTTVNTNSEYYPACSSSYTSITSALVSIGVDSSFSYRTKIAVANGITDYSGTADQNTQMLNLLKSGKLINPSYVTTTEPTETTVSATEATTATSATEPAESTASTEATQPTTSAVSYFPACDSCYTTISTALVSIGVDNSFSYRKTIAAANGITNYTGTVDQNTQMLNLLKAGKLINPSGTAATEPTTSGSDVSTTYAGGPAGDGKGIYAYGVDISKWQADGIDFSALKEGGIDYVIIRAGYRTTTDPYFEYNYYAAKEAGLDVGAYWYSYATTADGATEEAEACANVITGKKFEYPIYFDFEDSTQMSLSAATKKSICTTWLDNMSNKGYLVGLYSMYSEFTGDLIPSTISPNYEAWVARYLNSGTYASYADYHSKYGMWQYSATGSVSGYSGDIDCNVAFKDYPSIVKKYGFNGYSTYSTDDFNIADIGTGFYATITASNTKKALTVGETGLSASTVTEDSNQLWKFEYQEDGTYKILNKSNEKYLDVLNADVSASAVIQTADVSESESQNWYVTENSDGTYSLLPICGVTAGKVIDISDDGVISLSVSGETNNQKLNITVISEYLLGDVNCDGTINVLDATEIQKIIAALIDTSNYEINTLADVNADKNVNIKDATLIQMYCAGVISEFPNSNGSNNTEPTTEPTTEPSTEHTTEPTTNPTTEPTTEATTEPTTSSVQYFPACDSSCTTISAGLSSIGVDYSFTYRKTIAAVNGITNYSGTAEQNTQMLNLLKQGKLIVP